MGKKLQYYIQIEHIKAKIEAKKNHIYNHPAFHCYATVPIHTHTYSA